MKTVRNHLKLLTAAACFLLAAATGFSGEEKTAAFPFYKDIILPEHQGDIFTFTIDADIYRETETVPNNMRIFGPDGENCPFILGEQKPIVQNNTVESSSSDPNLDENGFPTIESYGEPPAAYTKDILNNGQTGWSSRYWDACKGHCSQRDNVATESDEAYAAGLTVMRNCNIHDVEVPAFTLSPDVQQYYMGYKGTDNACQTGEAGTFTCTDMAPIQVTENLSYGYVAAPGVNAACGKCFHLQFNGGNKINDVKPTHLALKGKHMIVLASNIGHDVESGQFDMMVPGGGVGNFNALSTQIGVPPSGLGAGGGGFLTECQLDKGLGYNNTLEAYQQCVIEKCDEVFKDWPNLLRGCKWFAEWYMAADNPTYNWEEVECPQYLIDHYVSSYNTKKDNNYKWHDDWSTFKKGDVLDTLHCWGPGQNPDPNGGAGCL